MKADRGSNCSAKVKPRAIFPHQIAYWVTRGNPHKQKPQVKPVAKTRSKTISKTRLSDVVSGYITYITPNSIPNQSHAIKHTTPCTALRPTFSNWPRLNLRPSWFCSTTNTRAGTSKPHRKRCICGRKRANCSPRCCSGSCSRKGTTTTTPAPPDPPIFCDGAAEHSPVSTVGETLEMLTFWHVNLCCFQAFLKQSWPQKRVDRHLEHEYSGASRPQCPQTWLDGTVMVATFWSVLILWCLPHRNHMQDTGD